MKTLHSSFDADFLPLNLFLIGPFLFILNLSMAQSVTFSTEGAVLPKVNFETLESSQIGKEGMLVYDSSFQFPRYFDGKKWAFGLNDENGKEIISRFLPFKGTPEFNKVITDFQGNTYFLGKHGGMEISYEGDTLSHPANTGFRFIGKLDKNGHLLWWYIIKSDQIECYDIATDQHGNVFIGGDLFGPTSFDGFTTTNPSHYANRDGFLLKLTSNGSFGWVKTIIGSFQVSPVQQIETFADGSLIIGGTFRSSLIYQWVNLTNTKDTAYIIKLDPNGNATYMKTFGASGYAQMAALKTNIGDWGVAINFNGNYAFGLQTIPSDSSDIFVQVYNSNDQLTFYKHIAGTNSEICHDLFFNQNHLILSGNYKGAISVGAFSYSNGNTDYTNGFLFIFQLHSGDLLRQIINRPIDGPIGSYAYITNITHDYFGGFYAVWESPIDSSFESPDSDLLHHSANGQKYGVIKFLFPTENDVELDYIKEFKGEINYSSISAHKFYKGFMLYENPKLFIASEDGFDLSHPKFDDSSFLRHVYENF